MGFYEVKVDSSRFDTARLGEKVAAFFAKNPDKRRFKDATGLLAVEDM